MKIISKRQLREAVEYNHHFEHRNMPGAGYGFTCNERGEVDVGALNPCAAVNYQKCLNGTYDVIDQGIQKSEWSWVEPAIGLCGCGSKMDLDGFTNTCDRCGRDYNMSGQLLAPRSQWGEETGETLDEILRIR